MHRQNEGLNEKSVIVNNYTLPSKLPLWEPKITKVRKRLLIIIAVLLSFCCINFILALVTYTSKASAEESSATVTWRFISIILWIIYYSDGFSVAHRYHRSGLLCFAWGGLLSLLISAVIIIAATMYAIKLMQVNYDAATLIMIVVIVFGLICSLLQIFAVRYAFALAKSLKNPISSTTAQI